MGDFRIVIDAIGGHGCMRECKEGDPAFTGCGQMSCPDCRTAEFLRTLAASQCGSIKSATLTHWPGQPTEVVDTFQSPEYHGATPKRTRKGSF